MADINITGNSLGGRFNIIEYNFNQPTNINTYNNSLCAVQVPSNTLQTLREYRPGNPVPPFTQFLPGSGYIILAKDNFSLTGIELPIETSINITGDPSGGRFNIFKYNSTSSTNISSYNSSLCAVQTTSNTQQTLREYRPSNPVPPFTQFIPGSGYVVLAKSNFSLSLSGISILTAINGDALLAINGDNLVPIQL